MKAKAKKYDAIRRGDFSKLSKKDMDEGVIDVGPICCARPQVGRADDAVRTQIRRGAVVGPFIRR